MQRGDALDLESGVFGRNLPAERRILSQAKVELRKAFHREAGPAPLFLDLATAGVISAPRVKRDRNRAVARDARWCACVFMLWMAARVNQHLLLPCRSAPSKCKLVGL